MGKGNELFKTIANKVGQQFEIKNQISDNDYFKDEDHLKSYISNLVSQMIESNFERFLNQMYILDVSEKRLNEIISTSNPEDVSLKIAELIIDREKEKNFWREKYKT
jgi:hypothetical protein